MYCPRIIVFNSEYAHLVINSLDKIYPVFYNNDTYDYNWIKKNCVNGRLYFIYDNIVYDFTVDDISEHFYMPHFMLLFNDDIAVEITSYGWDSILQMFNLEILNSSCFDVESIRFAEELLTRLEVVKADEIYESETCNFAPDKIAPEYSFRLKCVNDQYFYEIVRGGEIPFVVVNEKGSVDHSTIFTSIYASKNWDSNRLECRHDYGFLVQLWKKLELPGEFTMDFVNSFIKKCYPENGTALAEPVVYRNTLENVVETVYKRKRGVEVPDFIVKRAK